MTFITVAAIVAIGATVAVVGMLYEAMYRQVSARFANLGERPAVMDSRTPAKFLSRLREETVLAVATWVAGASFVVTAAKMILDNLPTN